MITTGDTPRIAFAVPVPMSDGVSLSAVIYPGIPGIPEEV
jgi:hypothetical protein